MLTATQAADSHCSIARTDSSSRAAGVATAPRALFRGNFPPRVEHAVQRDDVRLRQQLLNRPAAPHRQRALATSHQEVRVVPGGVMRAGGGGARAQGNTRPWGASSSQHWPRPGRGTWLATCHQSPMPAPAPSQITTTTHPLHTSPHVLLQLIVGHGVEVEQVHLVALNLCIGKGCRWAWGQGTGRSIL